MIKKRPLPPKPSLPPKKPVVIKPKVEVVRGDASSIAELFAAFFKLCKERLLHVLAVMLLASVTSLLLLGALGFGLFSMLGMGIQQIVGSELQDILSHPQNAALLGGGVLLMLLTACLLWVWSYTAILTAAVDEHHGIIESLCTGWKYLFSMMWVSTLYFGITFCWIMIVGVLLTGGMAAMFQLAPPILNLQHLGFAAGSILAIGAIIPGLVCILLISIVPLSIMFGDIVMIDEGHSNIDALLISRLYVRGHWWDTLFKLFLIWLLLLLIQLPFLLLPFFAPFPGHQIVTQLVSFITTPLMLLYTVAIYRDLKKAAGKVNPDTSWRCLWRLLAAAGILLPLLGIILAAVTSGPKIFSGGSWKTQGMNEPRIISTPPAAVPSSTEPTVQPVPAVNNTIIWRDPVGDTSNPLLDIREVTAEGKRGELLLTVTLAKPLSEYFAAKSRDAYAQLVSVYLDVDRDEATGAALPDDAGRKGYDFELNVLLATPSDAPDKGKAYASLYAIGPQKRQSLAPLSDGAASIADSTLTIRLPYERLDAAAGGRLKICFRETAQAVGGLSQDQIVPLK
jgi:hypothetical protein